MRREGLGVFPGKNQSCSPCRETHRTGGDYADYDAIHIYPHPLDEALGRERTCPSGLRRGRPPVVAPEVGESPTLSGFTVSRSNAGVRRVSLQRAALARVFRRARVARAYASRMCAALRCLPRCLPAAMWRSVRVPASALVVDRVVAVASPRADAGVPPAVSRRATVRPREAACGCCVGRRHESRCVCVEASGRAAAAARCSQKFSGGTDFPNIKEHACKQASISTLSSP